MAESASNEARSSIEAHGDAEGNVTMGGTDAERQNDHHDTVTKPNDYHNHEDADMDADGEPDDEPAQGVDYAYRRTLHLIRDISEHLCLYKVSVDGELVDLAAGFQRLVNKRSHPDYFEIIKEPMAFSTIRAKLNKKSYSKFSEFVHDVTRICHNAQLYNRPSSQYFIDASRLLVVFKEKLQELVEKGLLAEADAHIPDFGPLPDFEDSPTFKAEEGNDDDDEDDEDENENDSDNEGGRRKRKHGGRQQRKNQDEDDEYHKKKGRPPKLLNPEEARIDALLKGLRKLKADAGHLRVAHFERLPDKSEVPYYYDTIKSPMALDMIKKNHKRKKYASIDHVVADLDLIFENAKVYNEEGSEVYEDAVELQKQAHMLAEQEKAKSDDVFRGDDGKLPLSHIHYNGDTWRVGDWVHIRNANDLQKPIVAQLFRLWSDKTGQKWVNACWYYRPEQTVHRFDKHFYENEVAKTGQYRDHRFKEVEDRCFVMFHTRYNRGRPHGFPADKAVYVCESRYNEESYRFARIKTWSSCLPDEVRERDYEMDMFPATRVLKKNPSPIKHLLQADAKETDEPPKPTWGSPNAPPIIGAVHRRPRGPNDSPPPEVQPPLHMAPNQIMMDPSRRSSFPSDVVGVAAYRPPVSGASMPSPSHGQYMNAPHFVPRPTGPHTPQPPVHHQPSHPHGQHHPRPMPQGPHFTPAPTYQHQQFAPQPFASPTSTGHPFPPPSSGHIAPAHDPHHLRQPHFPQTATSPARPSQMLPGPAPNTAPMGHHHTMPASHGGSPGQGQYNVSRAPEVYTLQENIDAALPDEIRSMFQRDEMGRVLFYTTPPLERPHKGVAESHAGLGHSVSHLAHIKDIREERRRKRKERDEMLARAAEEHALDRDLASERDKEAARHKELAERTAMEALEGWAKRFAHSMAQGTDLIEQGNEGWSEIKMLLQNEWKALSPKERRTRNEKLLLEDMVQKGKLPREEL